MWFTQINLWFKELKAMWCSTLRIMGLMEIFFLLSSSMGRIKIFELKTLPILIHLFTVYFSEQHSIFHPLMIYSYFFSRHMLMMNRIAHLEKSLLGLSFFKICRTLHNLTITTVLMCLYQRILKFQTFKKIIYLKMILIQLQIQTLLTPQLTHLHQKITQSITIRIIAMDLIRQS